MGGSGLVDIFREISKDLDARNDKSERIVKLSRDITIESKRTISLLQRSQLQSPEDRLLTFQKADSNLVRVRRNHFFRLARELDNESPFYFNRSYTFGLQEYIEAVSFLHYLKEGTLIGHGEVQKSLVFLDFNTGDKNASTTETDNSNADPCKTGGEATEKKSFRVHVSQHDYILGLMDLTGELMRATINASPVESYQFIQDSNNFLKLVYQGAQALYGYRTKELSRKMSTLLSSVLKIESYVYSLKIRELDTFGGALTKPILLDTFGDQQNRNNYNDDYDSGTD